MESVASLRQATANWWVYLLSGILLIIVGSWVFSYPAETYLGLSLYFASSMLVNGFSGVFFAVTNRRLVRGWGWVVLLGIGEVILGSYLLAMPALAADTLAAVIGFWIMYRGTIIICEAFVLNQLRLPNWGWVLFLGITAVMLAFLILSNHLWGAFQVSYWVATSLVLAGIATCLVAFRLRQARHILES